LYWNVSGNGWVFSMDDVEASVELPPGAASQVMEMDAYTGAQGAKGKDFVVSKDFGKILYRTTKHLPAYEGLTIVVTWPKGFVAEPTPAQKRAYFIKDNLGILTGVLGLVLIFLYYFTMWVEVGRDPATGTIIPLFQPPDGFSPAAVRNLSRMGYDEKIF